MHKEFLMGNEAIALGALSAGVNLVAGYPGTPSTEVLQTIAKRNPGNVYVEWSVNEKAGLEVAAGAAYAGARSLVTMKQVGLNVASDPLMSLEYIGVKGGMVVLVADDPGPISSQTEQDTRTFGMFSKVPVFDPVSVRDAYEMIQEAFDFSEKYGTPVILRATTRIDHGYEALEVKDPEEYRKHEIEGFVKDSSRWVIFPRLSVKNHALIEERNEKLKEILSGYPRNRVIEADQKDCRKGIASHGANFQYVRDVAESREARLLCIATPFPFPEGLALSFLEGLDEVLCVEELDPVIERALTYVCGKYGLHVKIRGKRTRELPLSGENTPDLVSRAIRDFLGLQPKSQEAGGASRPELLVRPPVLCAGCPHRASFYAVKTAMKGEKTIFCGDIGCYTLGNAKPLDMCDTCLCMGAGIGIAQGVYHMEGDTKCFAFVGDSTFFASALPETINAFYNQAELVLVVLDNSTTAMTGHQPHPGTGRTAMGQEVEKVSIEKLLRAIGLKVVETVDPLDFSRAVETVRRVAGSPGVKAVIFKSPCIAISRPSGSSQVDPEKCTGCKKCIRELGCPALILDGDGKKAKIDAASCTGCTLCEQLCPAGAIFGGRKNDTVQEADHE
ncbi:MAG: indolepyruvate ferredoxin oxidoreductase subunit alpha [Lachnospiraceae bacterium]|nr:indolepyruvate ferredoxin oxidoreductase subunit alpha [Lachnospiraceae bacterium]